VFAISFAFISVAVGVFATYGELLATAGPVGIWLWVVAGVGQTLVALVVAQFAARIALSGSSYQWASRLANPKIGWLFGWLTFWYLAIAVVAMDSALASQAFMPLSVAALIWVAGALFVLVTPGDALVPNLIVVGLIVAGGIYFAKMMIFNRDVLDADPESADAVGAAPKVTG
jgi:amino acid transporter